MLKTTHFKRKCLGALQPGGKLCEVVIHQVDHLEQVIDNVTRIDLIADAGKITTPVLML